MGHFSGLVVTCRVISEHARSSCICIHSSFCLKFADLLTRGRARPSFVLHQEEEREEFGVADFGFTVAKVAAMDAMLVVAVFERRALDLRWRL